MKGQLTSAMENILGKTIMLSVLPRSLGKIEKSFSPKLLDYFIQGVKIKYEMLSLLNI